jgi:SAM-dependent methyltransferase
MRNMNKELKQSMLTYYDEWASEYDEIYTLGNRPLAVNTPLVYKEETNTLKQIINNICRGDLLDIPSGNAFWLPSYAQCCMTALLVEQSGNMFAESKQRAQQYDVADRCQFLQADIFEFDWPRQRCDVVLVGFFLSHLTGDEEAIFLSKVKDSLKPGGTDLVLDSARSRERAQTRPKEGEQLRKLNNGTEFLIYKKYFDMNDINVTRNTAPFRYKSPSFWTFSGT